MDRQDRQDKKGKGLRRVNLELGIDSRRGAKNAKIATRTRTQNLVSSIQNLGIGNEPRITRIGTDVLNLATTEPVKAT